MLQNPPRNHSSELTPPATPDARTYCFANGPKRCSGRSLLPCREVFTRRLASNDNPLGREPLDAFSRSLHTHYPQTHWFGLTPRSGATTSSAAVPIWRTGQRAFVLRTWATTAAQPLQTSTPK